MVSTYISMVWGVKLQSLRGLAVKKMGGNVKGFHPIGRGDVIEREGSE